MKMQKVNNLRIILVSQTLSASHFMAEWKKSLKDLQSLNSYLKAKGNRSFPLFLIGDLFTH